MGRCFLAILIALALFITLEGHDALGYPVPVDFDGKVSRWDISSAEDPVYFETVNESTLPDETTADLVTRSAGLWSAVEGSALRLSDATNVPGSAARITVQFKSNFDGGNFAAAYASIDQYDATGKPAHCTVNVAVRGGERLADLEKTVLHELGHCLGLGHSLFPRAIMSYRLDENAFALDVDDAAALRHLYPEGGSPLEIPPGCVISQNVSGRKAQQFRSFIDPSWLAAALLIAWLTGRRLRG